MLTYIDHDIRVHNPPDPNNPECLICGLTARLHKVTTWNDPKFNVMVATIASRKECARIDIYPEMLMNDAEHCEQVNGIPRGSRASALGALASDG